MLYEVITHRDTLETVTRDQPDGRIGKALTLLFVIDDFRHVFFSGSRLTRFELPL